jgi:hypothetical protein
MIGDKQWAKALIICARKVIFWEDWAKYCKRSWFVSRIGNKNIYIKLESEISMTTKQTEIKCPSVFIKMFHSVGILLFCNLILNNPTKSCVLFEDRPFTTCISNSMPLVILLGWYCWWLRIHKETGLQWWDVHSSFMNISTFFFLLLLLLLFFFFFFFFFFILFLFCPCCSHLEHRASVKPFVSLQFLNVRQTVELFGRGISPSQGLYLHTEQHKDRINSHTDIHTLGGIRTHNLSVRTGEDISCPRPRGHCHRLIDALVSINHDRNWVCDLTDGQHIAL